MKKKIRYTDEPMGKFKIVPNFLPSPEVLAKRLKNTKVTIALSADSVGYFKNEAAKHHVQYQKLIRQVLDEYVARHKSA